LKEDLEFFEEHGRWKPPVRPRREERRERRTGFRRRTRSTSRGNSKKRRERHVPSENRPSAKEMDSTYSLLRFSSNSNLKNCYILAQKAELDGYGLIKPRFK
jgi:hypothetical protein